MYPLAATVTLVAGGLAEIDQGRAEGLGAGEAVRFIRAVTIGEGPESHVVEVVIGDGRVQLLAEHSAVVELSRGVRLQVDDRAEPHAGGIGYPAAPERLDGIREVGLALRPLLALDTLGVALQADAWVTVVMSRPIYLQARVAPVVLGRDPGGDPLTIAAFGTGGYDTRHFAAGLGAGWSEVASAPNPPVYAADKALEPDLTGVDGAFTLVHEARLGARDGLRLEVRSTLLLLDMRSYVYRVGDSDEGRGQDREILTVDEGRGFVLGGVTADVAVPVSPRTDMFAGCGTGQSGATWAEAGAYRWLRGAGDVGSLGLRVGVGFVTAEDDAGAEQVELHGPLWSVAGRYRF